jgi:hypothetical protein
VYELAGSTSMSIKSIPVSTYFYSYYGEAYEIRELRKAFYTGDVNSFQQRLRSSGNRVAGLLNPFSRDIYDKLPQEIQLLFLQSLVQLQITGTSSSSEALQRVRSA